MVVKRKAGSAPADSKALKGQRNQMRMISRAAAILRAVSEKPSGLSLGEIGHLTGLPRSTVQRLVGALEVERLVATEAATTGVRLGAEISRMADSAHQDVRLLFRPKIEQLQKEVEDNVDLTLLQGFSVVIIDRAFSLERALRVVSQIGSSLPLLCTSNGKAHLAQMPDADLKLLLSKPIEKWSENTIVSHQKLRVQIDAIRNGAFADDLEEYREGICAISLPIRGYRNENYAISVPMPSQRYHKRKELVQKALRKCQQSLHLLTGQQ